MAEKPFFDPVTKQWTTSEEMRRRWGGKRTVKGDVTFQDPSAKPVDGAPSTIDVEVEPMPPRTKPRAR